MCLTLFCCGKWKGNGNSKNATACANLVTPTRP
jgi:hypothetical protein